MLSNAFLCRELTPLLTDQDNPTDAEIRALIRDAESKINIWLAGKYVTPIQPISYLSGTVSISKGDSVLNGSGTTFTDLKPGQVIQIVSTGEVLRIETITNDTELFLDSDAVNVATGSDFWVVPDELVTASKYLATQLIIMLYFSEKTLKQDNVEKFDRRLEYFAMDIIKMLKSGDYLNTDLQQQAATKNRARLIKVFSSDLNTAQTDFTESIMDLT